MTSGDKAMWRVCGAAGLFDAAPWLTVVTGHYGVGKTNLSLNLARDLRRAGRAVTLVDLDIVNPYFRSTDNQSFLDAEGIRVLGPVYAASNLDTPSLSPGIDEAILGAGHQAVGGGHAVSNLDFGNEQAVLIDVGGDSDGARALGRYQPNIVAGDYRLVFVVNLHRPETATVAANLELLRGIEETSGLKVSTVIGNSHLKQFSSVDDILATVAATAEIAQQAGAELAAITAPRPLAAELAAKLADMAGGQAPGLAATASEMAPAAAGIPVIYPVDTIVQTPWE